MASWKKLKYGFAVVAGVLAITGVTIYQVGRWRVSAIDCIELMQGTIERCLAAGTNNVALPNYVKTFTVYIYTNTVITNLGYDTTNTIIYTNEVMISNVMDGTVVTNYQITTNYVILTGTNYATNVVSFVITNTYSLTNALGNRIDKDYLLVLDPIIEALAPFYVDTNTVFDGTTNILMHTFTGLLARLDIGDHTNFTDYGWRISTNELRERYEVLYYFTHTQLSNNLVVNSGFIDDDGVTNTYTGTCFLAQSVCGSVENFYDSYSWTATVAEVEHDYVYHDNGYGDFIGCYTIGALILSTRYHAFMVDTRLKGFFDGQTEEIAKSAQFFVSTTNENTTVIAFNVTNGVWDANGLDVSDGVFSEIGTIVATTNEYAEMTNWFGHTNWPVTMPNWCAEVTTNSPNDYSISDFTNKAHAEARGFQYRSGRCILNWITSTNGFQYCTNALN